MTEAWTLLYSSSDSSPKNAKRVQWSHASKTGDQGGMTPKKGRRRMEGYSWGRQKDMIQNKEESGKDGELRDQRE